MDCRVFAPRKEPLLLSAVNDSVVRISPPSRWNGAPTTARKHRCSLMGVLFCLGRRAGSEWKATCLCRCTPTLPEGNSLRGIDAPTTARTVGLPPRRGKDFLSKRKKVPKKASGTATTGKRLLLPILTAGLAMSRAMELGSFHQLLERARARLFPPSKWAGLFPFAAYRRSAPPQLACGRLKWRCLGCVYVAWMASQRRKTDLTFLL